MYGSVLLNSHTFFLCNYHDHLSLGLFPCAKWEACTGESGTACSLPPSPSPGHHGTLCLSMTLDVSQEPLSLGFLGQLIPLSIKSSGPRISLISYFNMHTSLYMFVTMVFTQISSFLEDRSPSFPVLMQSSNLICKGYVVTSKADSVGVYFTTLDPRYLRGWVHFPYWLHARFSSFHLQTHPVFTITP